MTDFSTKYSYGDMVERQVHGGLVGDPKTGIIDSISIVSHGVRIDGSAYDPPKVTTTYKVNGFWYCEDELSPYVKPVAVGDVVQECLPSGYNEFTYRVVFLDELTAVIHGEASGRRACFSRSFFNSTYKLVDA